MGTLNPKIPSEELGQELAAAAALMQEVNQRLMTPEVLLLTFVRRPGSAAHRLLANVVEKQGYRLGELDSTVETMARMRAGRDIDFGFSAQDGRRIGVANELTRVLDNALTIAERRDEVRVNTDHVLVAMAQPGMTTSGVLQRYGLTPSVLEQTLTSVSGRGGTVVDYVALGQADNLPPVYLRTGLLQELIGLLSLAQPRGRHVILIGPAGVGKQSLALGLALLMAQGKGPPGLRSLIRVSEQALLDEAVKSLQAGLGRAREGILFVPHIHRFFGGRLDAEFYEAGAPLRKALFSNTVAVIGTTDQPNYERLMSKTTAVIEQTHRLAVPPATAEETVAILRVHQPALERDYAVKIDSAALDSVASLAERYLAATPLPGAAMNLIHRTAASLRALRPAVDQALDTEDATLTLSQMTGIPVNKLGADERTRYARMVEHLHQRIIGQEEAVMAVSRAVKTARVGLKDPNRPIGSFLFLGPTGVGKTELAKALAEFLFGEEEAAVEIDMSEYQQEHAVNRLIGAPPGYVGHEAGGQLTDAVRERPYTVVLFDEVEKAHSRVTDILLQIMEEARLTDGQGRTARFNETVIILTSNLGSEYLVDATISDAQREIVMEAVKQHFRPEFLNRLDDIILFHPLSPDQMRLILGLMLKKEVRLAAGGGISLETSEAAATWLLAQNDHPEWGARPLRRILRRYLRDPLADFMLQAPPQPGTAVRVDAGPSGLVFSVSAG